MILWLLLPLALGAERLSLDPVFVSRFDAAPGLEAEAEALRVRVEQALATRHLVIPREDVPPYEDYDAETYLQGCPPAERLGCAWVVGERAEAEWVLSARLEATTLSVDVVEVGAAEAVLGVSLERDPDLPEHVLTLMDLVVSARPEARDQADLDVAALRRAVLSELEGELDDLQLRAPMQLDRPRLTRADLAEWEGREDSAPWEDLGMDQAEYLRYRNSGLPLDAWEERARGRAGRLTLSVAAGGARGPLSTHLDARWALDESLQVVALDEQLEVRDGASSLVSLGLGLGLAPMLALELCGTWRGASVGWLFHDEVVGETVLVPPSSTTSLASAWQVGGRVRLAPLPTYGARPTLALGASALWLPDPAAQVGLGEFMEHLSPHLLTLAELRPGAEVDLSAHLQLFAEVGLGLVLAGDETRTHTVSPELLSERATPTEHGGVLTDVAVGLRVRSPRLGGPR